MTRPVKFVLALQLAGVALSLLLHNGELTASGLLLLAVVVAVLLPGSILVIVAEQLTRWSPHLPPRLQSLETAVLAAAVNLLLVLAWHRVRARKQSRSHAPRS